MKVIQNEREKTKGRKTGVVLGDRLGKKKNGLLHIAILLRQ
jgi:hypothetical protein